MKGATFFGLSFYTMQQRRFNPPTIELGWMTMQFFALSFDSLSCRNAHAHDIYVCIRQPFVSIIKTKCYCHIQQQRHHLNSLVRRCNCSGFTVTTDVYETEREHKKKMKQFITSVLCLRQADRRRGAQSAHIHTHMSTWIPSSICDYKIRSYRVDTV